MAAEQTPKGTDPRLFRLLLLSIGAAVATIALKTVAWLLTGSVGLLSDAAESVVNLVRGDRRAHRVAPRDEARRRGARLRAREGRVLLRGHRGRPDLAEEVEAALRGRLPYATVFTHVEPVEDPRSFDDTTLDR